MTHDFVNEFTKNFGDKRGEDRDYKEFGAADHLVSRRSVDTNPEMRKATPRMSRGNE